MVFDSTGVVTLSIFALNECGSNTGTRNFTVRDVPTLVASIDTILCPGQTVTLTSTTNGTGQTWFQTGVNVGTNPSLFVTPSGTPPDTFIVVASNTYNCKSRDTVLVDVFPPMVLTPSSTDATCNGLANGSVAVLVNGGTTPFIYAWNTNPPANTPIVSNLPSGNYTVIVTDSGGCTANTTAFVSEPPLINLTINAINTSFTGQDGQATVIINGGTPPYTIEWSTNPVQTGITATGLAVGTYTVTVTDTNGCQTTATFQIDYMENGVYIPNAFSPNGDGINDFLTIFGANIDQIIMQVYNRWGQLIFTTDNVNKPWDGKFNGIEQEVAVYVWTVSATFLDGKSKDLKGNATLLR